MLGRELYEKFNISSSNKEYILLDAQGNLIEDVCKIYFSTTLLFICEKFHYQRKFAHYLNILENSNTTVKRLSFSEGLKKSFRNKIVSGNFEDYSD